MAKQYDEYNKTFASIQKEVESVGHELKKNANFMSQTSGVIKEGIKEVGNRIQELKDTGKTGTDIKDFADDGEVKKMLASLDGYMSGIEKEIKRITAVHEGASAKVRTSFWDTKKELAAEIAKRKKEASTKLGLGNKSLPDMEKLLKEMDKYKDSAGFVALEAFVPEEISQHRKELNYGLQDEIKKAKDLRLSSEQQMLDEQALNLRNLVQNVAAARKASEEVLKLCADAQEALEKRNQKALMTAKASLPPLLKALSELASIGERALKDEWIKSKIKTSKDQGKIVAGIKSIADYKTDATKAVSLIANAKL